MNDSATRLDVAIVEGIEKIPREAWDGLLAPDESPFVEWDWLFAMEHSGSAARKTGMGAVPSHRSRGTEETNRRRVPLYLKTHSMGEFCSINGWADAAEARNPLFPEADGRCSIHAA